MVAFSIPRDIPSLFACLYRRVFLMSIVMGMVSFCFVISFSILLPLNEEMISSSSNRSANSDSDVV